MQSRLIIAKFSKVHKSYPPNTKQGKADDQALAANSIPVKKKKKKLAQSLYCVLLSTYLNPCLISSYMHNRKIKTTRLLKPAMLILHIHLHVYSIYTCIPGKVSERHGNKPHRNFIILNINLKF